MKDDRWIVIFIALALTLGYVSPPFRFIAFVYLNGFDQNPYVGQIPHEKTGTTWRCEEYQASVTIVGGARHRAGTSRSAAGRERLPIAGMRLTTACSCASSSTARRSGSAERADLGQTGSQ